MTLSQTKPNLPLPDPFLAGVFLFPATGITLAAGTAGRPGLPATAPGPWRAAVAPARRHFRSPRSSAYLLGEGDVPLRSVAA
jgi:hypothetical protein